MISSDGQVHDMPNPMTRPLYFENSIKVPKFETTIDKMQETIEREEARLYNVARFYRPTLAQYRNLLNLLKGSLQIHRLDEESTNLMRQALDKSYVRAYKLEQDNRVYREKIEKMTDQINGVSHQLDKVRSNLDQAITQSKILFKIGKFVVLK